MKVDVRARMSGDWEKPAAADIRLDGTVDAPDGAALLRLIGLDRYLAAGKGAGQLKLLVAGPADRDQSIDLRLSAEGLSAQSIGHGRLSLDKGLQLTSSLQVAKANLRPLRPAGMSDSGEPLPFSLNSRIAVADRAISFSDVNARLGGATIRGNLAFDGQTPRKVSGALDADTIDAAPLIVSAIGLPVAAGNSGSASWAWSGEPFAAGLFGAFNGEIAFKARQVALLPRLAAREFRANLRFDKGGFAVDDATGDVSGGRLTGRAVVPLRRGWPESTCQDFADRRRCGQSAAVWRAAAGDRLGRFVRRR